VYTTLRDNEEALNQLSLFIAANPGQGAAMLKDESWQLRALRADPRYPALIGSR
jgi:hypothetical protein